MNKNQKMKPKNTVVEVVPVLKWVLIISLALNLPGPAALMRFKAMGAECIKLEPPSAHGSADPMFQYARHAYDAMLQGVRKVHADLKTVEGQSVLQPELSQSDVLMTSFRPAALTKLGLEWTEIQATYPRLSMITIKR